MCTIMIRVVTTHKSLMSESEAILTNEKYQNCSKPVTFVKHFSYSQVPKQFSISFKCDNVDFCGKHGKIGLEAHVV